MKTIMDMAFEAGFTERELIRAVDCLVAFAAIVCADEREACAKVCDAFQARDVGMQPAECAGAIRARGQA